MKKCKLNVTLKHNLYEFHYKRGKTQLGLPEKCYVRAGYGLPVSVSGTLAEHLLWPWATERSACPQSGILSGFAHMLCSTHPSKSRLSLGRQHIACYVVWAALLSAVALRTLYFTHFKLFYFPNLIRLVQRIVRFACVPNRKPRTERFNTNTRIVTPLVYVCMYVYVYIYIYIYIYI